MKSPVDSLPPAQLCYHHLSQDYWMPDAEGKWIRINETSAKRYLKSCGYGGAKDKDAGNSEIDEELLRIQQSQNVGYASKLAGYHAGLHTINGSKVLVTESPKLIVPQLGDWPLLEGILEGMLCVDGVDQRPYFYGWLKCSLESIYSGKWSQAQVLAFAGPANSAKSLTQSIITEIMGGRSAKPFLYMTGRTDFNFDLFQAEHLMVEDDVESIDFKARRAFGAHIKQVAVDKTHQCHGKNRDGLVLSPWWRMTISLNDDPERLLVLPPLADDIEGKLMLFRVASSPMPMPTDTADLKEAFWLALVAELPAFVDAMLKYQIPEEIRCARFGVRHYHHPDLVQALNETAPEARLLALIDKKLFPHSRERATFQGEPQEYSALDLERKLTEDGSCVVRETRLLLTYPTACGAYLGRLNKSHPERVQKRLLHGNNMWKLFPPPYESVVGEDAGPKEKPRSLMQTLGADAKGKRDSQRILEPAGCQV